MVKVVNIRTILLTLLSLLYFLPVFSQQATQTGKRRIEILHSDLMTSESSFRRLIGNVSLKHKEMYMTCDSAHYFERANLVKAYSRVHIYKGDTLHLYGDYLLYDSNLEKAELTGEVTLIDNETTLETDHIYYDMDSEIASYKTGGRITNEDNILTSIVGRYFSKTEIFHFRDSVKLVNPDYTMYSDTLVYDTTTEIAYFMSPTEVIGDSLYARCNVGWYDTRNEKSLLRFNAMVDNKKQIVSGDSIYYESENGYGTAYYNVTISDRTKDIVVKGNKAWYYKDPERFMMTDSAQFIQTREDDFLFLHADTLWSITVSGPPNRRVEATEDVPRTPLPELPDSIADAKADTIPLFEGQTPSEAPGEYRLLRAYFGCRIFSQDLQATCDSLAYSFVDSVIRMYYSPIIWSDENQLTSDSIFLFTKNDQMERMEMYNNAFVIEEVEGDMFQQIKGKNLTGYFTDNSLHKIEVRGNGENIYYAIEENEIVGVNQSTCASMDIYLDSGRIKQIYFLKSPDGSLDPPQHKNPSERKLKDFAWHIRRRPANRFDIFRRDPQEAIRTGRENTAIIEEKDEPAIEKKKERE